MPIKLLLAALMLTGASLASAATYTYELKNTNGGKGTVAGTDTNFTLTGADNGNVEEGGFDNTTTFSTVPGAARAYTFNWSYESHDEDSTGPTAALFDPAGYFVNDTLNQLTVGSNVSGVKTVTLKAGDRFGWYVFSQGSAFGAGVLTVDVTAITAVPEPGTWTMLLAGLGLLGFMRRRKA